MSTTYITTLFLPHALLYLAFWKFDLPVQNLHVWFDVLNFLLFFVAFFAVIRRGKDLLSRETLFWATLFLSLWFPGAYLEFPSDPWEHLQRINQWGHISLIEDAIYPQKIATFWFYSLLKWFDISHRRIGLDILSAGLQTAMLFQFQKIFERFEITRDFKKVQILGVLVLFGTNLFSFRYYAISTTIVAYIAYLSGLNACFDLLNGKRRALLGVLGALLITITNHRQEVFYLVTSGTILGALFILQKKNRWKSRIHAVLLVLLVDLTGLGPILVHEFPQIYDHFGRGNFNSFGAVKTWDPSLPFLQTWGVHGLFAIVFSIAYFRELLPFSALTLFSFLLVTTPIGFVAISPFLTHATDAYRVLYAFPTSITLLGGISVLLKQKASRFISHGTQNTILCLALLLMSISPKYPWRGRLTFQFYRPSSTVSLTHLDQLAAWIKANRNWDPTCQILTDRATRFAMAAFLGSNRPINRFVNSIDFNTLTTPEAVAAEFVRGKYCAILIVDAGKIATFPYSPDSWVPRLSHHWSPLQSDPISLRNLSFEKAVGKLASQGPKWTTTTLSPFYTLIEPTQQPK